MVEDTQWFRVICFSRLAEFASEYLARGRRVFVEGRLQSRSWDGADGQKRFTMEIVAGDLVLLDQRPRTEGGEGVPVGARPASHDADLEDLPF
jgi:single-strand DNA-binding protein